MYSRRLTALRSASVSLLFSAATEIPPVRVVVDDQVVGSDLFDPLEISFSQAVRDSSDCGVVHPEIESNDHWFPTDPLRLSPGRFLLRRFLDRLLVDGSVTADLLHGLAHQVASGT
jgi:hypothetical protein